MGREKKVVPKGSTPLGLNGGWHAQVTRCGPSWRLLSWSTSLGGVRQVARLCIAGHGWLPYQYCTDRHFLNSQAQSILATSPAWPSPCSWWTGIGLDFLSSPSFLNYCLSAHPITRWQEEIYPGSMHSDIHSILGKMRFIDCLRDMIRLRRRSLP